MGTSHSNLTDELAAFLHRWSPESIARPELGEFKFTDLTDDVARLLTCVSRLRDGDLTLLPDDVVRSLRQSLSGIKVRFEEVLAFSAAAVNNPKERRDRLVHETIRTIEDTMRLAMPLVLYTNWEHPTRMDALFDASRAAIDQQTEELRTTVQQSHSVLEEAKKALAAAKETATNAGVGEHARHFKTEADNHERFARNWLRTSVAVFLGILGLSGWLVSYYMSQAADAPINIQATVAKVILYSTLVSGLVVSTRNYRTHRHNFVINRHRQNAMASFQSFAAGAQDDLTKNAVLIQATSSVFSQQPSGYLSSERDSDGVPQVVEIIRGIAERKKE